MFPRPDPQVYAGEVRKIEKFLRPDIVSEIAHLTQGPVILNALGSRSDQGWNCRTNALILGIAFACLGFRSTIIFGRMSFILGPTQHEPPVGIDVNPHSWIAIEGHGFVDVSVDLSKTEDERLRKLGRFQISNRSVRPRGRFVLTTSAAAYDTEVAKASTAEGQITAVYFGERFDDITSEFVLGDLFTFGNSPLTDQLNTQYASDVIAKASRHLVDLVRGKTSSLRAYKPDDAWARIHRMPEGTVSWITNRLKAK